MNYITFHRTALLFLVGLLAVGVANAQTNVNVVNTPSVHVKTMPPVTISGTPTVHVGSLPPVTGNVNVANTPNVSIANMPSVNINGTPSVNVANTRSTPVPNQDVDHPARHSFQGSCGGSADPWGQAYCSIGPIPANTEFVIQTLSTSGNGSIPVGGVAVGVNNGTTNASSFLPVVEQTPNYWAGIQSVTLYAGPNAVPSCTVQTTPSNGFVACTFVGYLVNLP